MVFSKDIIQSRRDRICKQLDSLLSENDIFIVCCGRAKAKPGGLDQTYDFIPHPDYYWLSGIRRAEGIVVYSKKASWIDFLKPISNAEIVWEGVSEVLPSEYRDLREFSDFVRVNSLKRFFVYGESTLENFNINLAENSDWFDIRTCLHQTRRIKDSAEVCLIEEAAHIAKKGYDRIRAFLREGVTEREIQIEYEAEIQRFGSHRAPYDTIVGTGDRAAVLHAIPTVRRAKKEELVLIDAGVDLFDYCVDITRVYPIDGKFSAQQENLYSLVLASQEKAISIAKPGTEWRSVHYESAKVIAEGLKNLNILRGDTESTLESGAISVFYPHGVGHLVGLRVRDTGCMENNNPQEICGVKLRVDMKIQEGHILTVEPGCYFIAALINDPEIRKKYKDYVNWPEAEKWLTIGGVRIEDDILITKGEPKNLTSIVDKF